MSGGRKIAFVAGVLVGASLCRFGALTSHFPFDQSSSLTFVSARMAVAPNMSASVPKEEMITAFAGSVTTSPLPASTNQANLSTRGQEEVNIGPTTYQYWDHSEHVLKLPESFQFNSSQALSLRLLEDVLRNKLNDSSCFKPDKLQTRNIANQVRKKQLKITYPVINVGMPKVGSTSLATFFNCSKMKPLQGLRKSTHDQVAKCMLEAAIMGQPPIGSCTTLKNAAAHMQLDCNWPESITYSEKQKYHCNGCAYPQIQLLDEIHQEYPNAPFILVHRPVESWIQSAMGWDRNLVGRWAHCRLPGLRHHDGKPLTLLDLKDWWCGHVHHVREFVRHHSSHPLIELDLYDSVETRGVLSTIFDAPQWCWRVANKKNATEKALNLERNSKSVLKL